MKELDKQFIIGFDTTKTIGASYESVTSLMGKEFYSEDEFEKALTKAGIKFDDDSEYYWGTVYDLCHSISYLHDKYENYAFAAIYCYFL